MEREFCISSNYIKEFATQRILYTNQNSSCVKLSWVKCTHDNFLTLKIT